MSKKRTSDKKAPRRRKSPTEPLLDIAVLTERPAIKIGGRRYEVRTPKELPLLKLRRFELMGQRLQEIGAINLAEATDADDAELSGILDDLCRLVLVAPAGVHAKLGDLDRMAIVNVFTGSPVSPELKAVTGSSPATTK